MYSVRDYSNLKPPGLIEKLGSLPTLLTAVAGFRIATFVLEEKQGWCQPA